MTNTSAVTSTAKRSPLTNKVIEVLRERILNGELPGGERLVESRISEELGVSRVPVREALRLLVAEGLVTIVPRRGATVAALNEEQVREMIDVRATLEALNAQLAARRNDPRQIAVLHDILDKGTQLSAQGDIQKYLEQNDHFHDVLGQMANNTLLQDIMRPLRERTAMFFNVREPEDIIRSWEEHASILRAVVAGDEELAALLARRHVYNAAGQIGAPAKATKPA